MQGGGKSDKETRSTQRSVLFLSPTQTFAQMSQTVTVRTLPGQHYHLNLFNSATFKVALGWIRSSGRLGTGGLPVNQVAMEDHHTSSIHTYLHNKHLLACFKCCKTDPSRYFNPIIGISYRDKLGKASCCMWSRGCKTLHYLGRIWCCQCMVIKQIKSSNLVSSPTKHLFPQLLFFCLLFLDEYLKHFLFILLALSLPWPYFLVINQV